MPTPAPDLPATDDVTTSDGVRVLTAVAADTGATAHPLPEGAAFRAVPLLVVVRDGASARASVGQARIEVRAGDVRVDAVVDATWSTATGPGPRAAGGSDLGSGSTGDAEGEATETVRQILREVVRAADVDPRTEPAEVVAATLAKAVAEHSRQQVAQLRELRYEIETTLATALRPDGRDSLQPLLAMLLELRVIGGRARDQAREAVREGLWVWRTDSSAYHSYRRSQDPTLLTGHEPADSETRPWMRTHDAAVRHCRSMEAQLGDESLAIGGLLEASATMASAKETESQQLFNLLVGIGALGLGLPALVISLYSADRLVPLSTASQALAMLPIALAAVAAGLLAFFYLPTGSSRNRRVQVIAVVLALVLLIVVAAVIAPAASG